MFNFFDKWLNSAPINIFPSRCVKSRYKHSLCEKCIGHCPKEAISFHGQLKIDEIKCNQCGICLNLCPTGAFGLNDTSYIKLFNKIENRGTIIFCCEKSNEHSGVKIPCLGFLNLSFLVSLIIAKKKYIMIESSQCQGCSNQTGLKVIRETVENTKTLIDMLGLDANINFLGVDFNNQHETPYSRREVLSLIRKQAANRVSDILNVVYKETPEDIIREQKIPEHRKLLLHFWPELSGPIQSQNKYLPFTEIRVNSNCNLCAVCVKACPTGALKIFEDDIKMVLKHNIDYCVKCGLCIEICPQGALKHYDTIELSNFNRKYTKDLMEAPKATCSNCGRDFMAKGSLICNSCSVKKQLAEQFFQNFN